MGFQNCFQGLSLKGWKTRTRFKSSNKSCGRRKNAESLMNDDMLMEILLHLPVKSVLNFRMVCKDWHRIISHPFFASAYRSCHGPPALSGIFSRSSNGRLSFHPIDSPLQSQVSASCLSFLSKLEPAIVAICDGLLLLRIHNAEHLVYNPATEASFRFSLPRSGHPWYDVAGIVYERPHFKAVFAYKIIQGEAPMAVKIDDLLINGEPVAIEDLDQSLANSLSALQFSTDVLQLDTFSSETKRWSTTTVKLPTPVFFHLSGRIALVIDQTIYWMLIDGGIVTYNVRVGCVGLIEAPPGSGKKDIMTLHRGPGGSLCYCRSGIPEVEIWMLSDNSGEKRWHVERKVSLRGMVKKPLQILHICLEQGVMFMLLGKKLARFLIENGDLEAFYEFNDTEQLKKLIPYVMPSWPSVIGGSKTKPPSKPTKRTRLPRKISVKWHRI